MHIWAKTMEDGKNIRKPCAGKPHAPRPFGKRTTVSYEYVREIILDFK
ncbi:hypothetical protein [Marinisporobacter balticus]|nr:hypothetical protein [Marinisporobacter balticus]